MKAIVKFARGIDGMGLREVPEPVPREGELKVRVIAAGICGGDLHSMKDERPGMVYPCIMGHEYVGQVVETCGNVGDFNIGDYAVTIPMCYSCGECEYCKAGTLVLCNQRASIGTHRDGTMAEYLVVPAKYSFKVPSGAEDIITYALAEPFVCAVHGVYERINVKPGDVAVVSGPGPIGQVTMQALKTRGAYVIACGLKSDEHRLKVAVELGADVWVDNLEDLQREIKKVNPEGADIVVEAAGHPASLDNCLEVAKKGSVLLQMGAYGGREIPVRFDITHEKEMTVYASNATTLSAWEIGLKLINEKKVNLKPLISMQLPLSEWKRGFDAAVNKEGYKILFCPELDRQ